MNGTVSETSSSCITRIVPSKATANGHSSPSTVRRLVVVRYYLDRPGYDINHSSARLWKNPPETGTSLDVQSFLFAQGIIEDDTKSSTRSTLLVEIYLDRFQTYMCLDACEQDGIELDFSKTTVQDPGMLNIRLTDLSTGQVAEGNSDNTTKSQPSAAAARPQICNTTPIGLFAFSLTVALETMDLTGKLCGGRIDPAFALTWGPYAFFVSGLLQFVVGLWEVTRNNIYGATAFLAFGSFWLANGTILILTTYFPTGIDPALQVADPWGKCIRNLYILAFVCVLFKQTLVMTKLTSTLIALLSGLMLATSFGSWSEEIEWIQMIFGWIVSVFAFYLFAAEFTNEVYHREVLKMYPWTETISHDEVFGAAGRVNNLRTKVQQLRAARNSTVGTKNEKSLYELRSVQSVLSC